MHNFQSPNWSSAERTHRQNIVPPQTLTQDLHLIIVFLLVRIYYHAHTFSSLLTRDINSAFFFHLSFWRKDRESLSLRASKPWSRGVILNESRASGFFLLESHDITIYLHTRARCYHITSRRDPFLGWVL